MNTQAVPRMRAALLLVTLGAAVTLTSVAAGGSEAAKQRVGISMKNLPNGTFVLTPLQSGPVQQDSGTVQHTVANYTPRVVVRNGQQVSIYKPVVWVLEGKRGTLRIREPRNEWVDAGADVGGALTATGTWAVVSGTGVYARIFGGGRTAHAGVDSGNRWFARQEGFLSLR